MVMLTYLIAEIWQGLTVGVGRGTAAASAAAALLARLSSFSAFL